MGQGFFTNRLRISKKSQENHIEKKIETIQGNGFVWTDLQNPDRDDVEKLAKKYFGDEDLERLLDLFDSLKS